MRERTFLKICHASAWSMCRSTPCMHTACHPACTSRNSAPSSKTAFWSLPKSSLAVAELSTLLPTALGPSTKSAAGVSTDGASDLFTFA